MTCGSAVMYGGVLHSGYGAIARPEIAFEIVLMSAADHCGYDQREQ